MNYTLNSKPPKKDKSNLFFLILFIIVIGVAFFANWRNENDPFVCKQSSKVEKILSIHYRSASILLENGRVEVVNQAKLKPGDDFCFETVRASEMKNN